MMGIVATITLRVHQFRYRFYLFPTRIPVYRHKHTAACFYQMHKILYERISKLVKLVKLDYTKT